MKKLRTGIFLAPLLALLFVIPYPVASIHATTADTSTSQSTDPDINSWMPDKQLQQAMQKLLGANVPLTQANLANITQANLTFQGITDLQGLQYATNLQSLDLTGNAYSDISPLSNLTKLTNLSLRLNKADTLPDLAPLKTTNIKNLNLVSDFYGDQPDKMAALADLNKLTTLDFVSGHLKSLPPLSPNAPLVSLDVSANKISDVSGLAHYTQLTTLGVSSNKISDWQPIAKLTNLTSLITGNNPQKNIAVLNSLVNLQKLNLSQLGLSNQDLHQLLPRLTKLQSLSIDFNNEVSDLSPVAKLTNLTYLNFSKDAITDLTPLRDLTNLTELNFTNNQVTNVSALQKLTNLTNLNFMRNQVLDLSPLKGLKNLQYFNAKFQFVTMPNLNMHPNQALTTTLTAKDIDGTVIPLTYASGANASVNGANVNFAGISADNTATFAWDNSNSNKISSRFTGTLIQPLTVVKDLPQNPTQAVKLLVMKGDNANLTSVASNYIMQQASLMMNPDGSGVLNFKAVVPVVYGSHSITFKDAKQVSANKAGDSYVLTYALPLSTKQLASPAILEQMHVDIKFNSFVYNNIYNVYFKILHSTNYNPQKPSNLNDPTFDGPAPVMPGNNHPITEPTSLLPYLNAPVSINNPGKLITTPHPLQVIATPLNHDMTTSNEITPTRIMQLANNASALAHDDAKQSHAMVNNATPTSQAPTKKAPVKAANKQAPANKTPQLNQKSATPSTKPTTTKPDVRDAIKKASAFIGALLVVIGGYFAWSFRKNN